MLSSSDYPNIISVVLIDANGSSSTSKRLDTYKETPDATYWKFANYVSNSDKNSTYRVYYF